MSITLTAWEYFLAPAPLHLDDQPQPGSYVHSLAIVKRIAAGVAESLLSSEDVEDITALTAEQAARAIGSAAVPVRNWYGMFATVARRRVIDLARTRGGDADRLVPHLTLDGVDLLELRTHSAPVEDDLLLRAVLSALPGIVAALPSGQRAAWEMYSAAGGVDELLDWTRYPGSKTAASTARSQAETRIRAHLVELFGPEVETVLPRRR